MSNDVKRYVNKSKRDIKKLESKPVWTWGKYEWLVLFSFMMVILSTLPDFLSIQYWMSGNTDMSAFSDGMVACYVGSSAIFFTVAYWTKNVPYLLMGAVSAVSTGVLVYYKYFV